MLEKAQAGYILAKGCEVVCGECLFLKQKADGMHGCAFFRPNDDISPTIGSCIFYTEGHLKHEIPWLAMYLPSELGYAENSPGFGCRRCSEFIADRDRCKEVGGMIVAFGCCNLWKKDSRRGGMTNEQLVQIMASPRIVLRLSR